MPAEAAMQMPTVARGVERASLNLRSEHEQEQAMRGPGGVSGLRRPAPPARCDKLHVAQEHHIGSVKGSPDRRQTADLEFAYEVGLDMNDFGVNRFDISSEASDPMSSSTRCSEGADFVSVAEAPPPKLRRRRLLARFRKELVALLCAR